MKKLVIGAVCVVLQSVAAFSEPAAIPLKAEDVAGTLEMPSLSRLGTVSPDGKLLAFTVADPKRVVGDTTRLQASPNARLSKGCDIVVFDVSAGTRRTIGSQDGGSWEPAWSPDGRTLAFISDRDGETRVWAWDVATGETRRVSDVVTSSVDLGVERLPQWTPDGRSVLVKVLPLGMTSDQLERLRSEGAPDEAFAKGSTLVLYRSVPASEGGAETGGAAVDPNRARGDLALVEVATGAVQRIATNVNSSWYRLAPDGHAVAYLDFTPKAPSQAATLGTMVDLKLVHVSSGAAYGAAPRVIAAGILQTFWPNAAWSPDSRSIAYIASPVGRAAPAATSTGNAPVERTGSSRGELFVATLGRVADAKATVRRVGTEPFGAIGAEGLVLWDASSRQVVAISDRSLVVGNVASGKITLVPVSMRMTGIVAAADENTYWSVDSSRSLYAAAADATTFERGYLEVDLQSGTSNWTHKITGSVSRNPVVAPDGHSAFFSVESAGESPAMWASAAKFASPRHLVTIDPRLDAYRFGTAKLIHFRGTDGDLLAGTLLLPAGYEPGKRYPLVVWVYASGHGTDGLGRFGLVGVNQHNMQMLATRGYAVLWPDIPVHVGTPMRDLMKAVIPAIDEVVAQGVADPDRLGVMGWSNGGYSTLALIVQTTRFKAAVMNAGFGDLTGFYGFGISNDYRGNGFGAWHPWLEHGGGAMSVPPWEDPQRYVENSPIYYLDRIQTPLIIMAGSRDIAIVPFSDQVFVNLKRLRKDATYLRYREEDHALTSYANLVDYWTRVTRFFDEKLVAK